MIFRILLTKSLILMLEFIPSMRNPSTTQIVAITQIVTLTQIVTPFLGVMKM